MPHLPMAVPVSRVSTARRADHDGCRVGAGDVGRSDCVKEMDRRIADAIRKDGLTRGAALALYGEAVEAAPEDPCAARDRLTASLGELVLA
jgi:hypothetical protein